jgi:acetolactate decarboxylase
MKKICTLVLGILLVTTVLTACAPANSDTLFQVTPFIALDRGYFDGVIACEKIKEHGDFGLGTFDGLDGEMVMLDGQIFQVRIDGIAYTASDSMLSPFVQVTFFNPDDTININNINSIAELKEYLDSNLPSLNTIYAIRIKGTFPYIKTRSVPPFEKPYPSLAEAVENQTVFELDNVTGTFVGFRNPPYMPDVNVPGYHFHFLTEDKKAGGHVLDCRIDNASAEIDITEDYYLSIPVKGNFYEADLNQESNKSASFSE